VEDFNYGIAYSLIEKQVGIKDKRVCELGAGTAAHLKWYKRDCREIVGLDISRQMMNLYLKTEGNSPNFNLITGDALILPFKSDAFDVVTIYQSAHHFPNIYTCMDEMLRVAGAFAFLEPNKDSSLHRLTEWLHERKMLDKRFEVQSYRTVEYNSSGFSALKIKYFLKKRNVTVKVYYIFQLPFEVSASIMRKSPFLFRILNLFGQAFTYIPIVKSQFGSLLVIAQKEKKAA
jgi:ubiquinone/menaquinone biosynthesis C-methylase UbiE